MKRFNNEKGIALVTALLLTLISLTFVMATLYMLTQGIKTTSSTKHYASALEATYGGVDFFTKDVLPEMLSMTTFVSSTFKNNYSAATYLNMAFNTTDACMQAKLTSTTPNWATGNVCNADQRSTDITVLRATPDMTFTLAGTAAGSSAYKVYAKIVDTPQLGNTDLSKGASLGLLTGGVVDNPGSGGIGVNGPSTIIPYLYTVEVQAEAAANPQETTRVTLLYAY